MPDIHNVSHLIFDLDGTLYDADNGYVTNIRCNIFNFLVQKGHAETVEEAEGIWRPNFKKYNQNH